MKLIPFGIIFSKKNSYKFKMDDQKRGEQIADMRFGMFICWSFSSFSWHEWTPTEGKDASYFSAERCNTDHWCKVAKDTGMKNILFLNKHHDGFYLWDIKQPIKK